MALEAMAMANARHRSRQASRAAGLKKNTLSGANRQLLYQTAQQVKHPGLRQALLRLAAD